MIRKLTDHTILYHGSYCEVQFPDLKQCAKYKDFDIVAGKIANDNTNATITAYMAGVFGEVGTPSADNICIHLLLPERLENQYCFRTEKALGCLTFTGSEQIWL